MKAELLVSYLWKVSYSTLRKQHHVHRAQNPVYRVPVTTLDSSASGKYKRKEAQVTSLISLLWSILSMNHTDMNLAWR